jgi:hypothetical protein
MNVLFIIIGALIALSGFVINYLKLYDLISGYNTMPQKEKVLFNIEKFATMMQNTFLVMGLVIILGALISIWTNIEFLGLIMLLVAISVCLPFLIIKGQKFKKL